MSYLTIDEIAKKFRVCKNTIRRQVMRGEIVSIRCGHSWRVPASEIEKLENNYVVPANNADANDKK